VSGSYRQGPMCPSCSINAAGNNSANNQASKSEPLFQPAQAWRI
jgi:hypothetical protein